MDDLNSSSYTQIQSWVDKNGFSHWAVAILWLMVALILFQVGAGILVVLMLFVTEGIVSQAEIAELIISRVDLLFIANSIGQILFIGLATFIVVNLNRAEEPKRNFLRLNWFSDTLKFSIYGCILIVVVQPIVIYLGFLNSLLPIPDWLNISQEGQYEMILNFLMTDGVIVYALIAIAVIPSVCEEILFRGYILRAFEKSWGIIVAILISGLFFGLFPLQAANLIPLATLGIILAVMTWLSGSIWPAIFAHFINNGMAVVVGINYPELFFQDITYDTLPPVWLLFVSIVLTCLIIYVMLNNSTESKSQI
jgi:membrane protease YdiL (CAAX protease family)